MTATPEQPADQDQSPDQPTGLPEQAPAEEAARLSIEKVEEQIREAEALHQQLTQRLQKTAGE